MSDTSGPLSYSAGPFNTANPTPVPEVDVGPHCNDPSEPCDEFALTVQLPSGYMAAHPNAEVQVTANWTDGGSGKSDYDLYIYQGAVTTTDGSEQAYAQSASSSDPEVASFGGLVDGTATYTIIIVPYTPTGETVNVTIALLPGAPGGGSGTFGGADPSQPGVPRYQIFYAPHGTSAEPSNGEFNIGFNPATRRIMTMNVGPIWRITPAEVLNAATPESCEGLWEDKSSLVTNTGLDPILWTDQKTGRTLASNSTAGANAVYAYTDNDGDQWTPIGIGPPDGGADHETIGTGPFPTSLSILATPLNQGENTLYCSQDIVGPAMCQRSLDLGRTWGPGVPAYTGSGPQGCGGLHGHVHVAPNGTAWLPVAQCNGHQGGVTSTDGGTTWTEFALPTSVSQAQGADPSIALDADSTAYYCYVNNEPVPAGHPPEGHVHVQVSRDGGKTWINDVDLGASHGIVNAAETEAVGGSSGRAACGFLGTNVAGDYQALSFSGVWYAFIATTYDGGQTWTTVNATPNDPVQSHTGVWQQGGSEQDRNLLDFNEITLDERGRVLYGFSDGCVSADCIAGTAPNDYTAWMRVARQSGGKSLLAAFDPDEPTVPNRACLAGTRDPFAAHLSWKAPDSGGADIDNYLIFRGTAPGQETLVGQSKGATTYDDTTTDPHVVDYYYTVKAINARGAGAASQEIKLQAVAPPPAQNVCTAPGLTMLTDPAGDASAADGLVAGAAPAGTDLLEFDLAQPLALDGVPKLIFTLKTDAGESPQPPGSAWYVAMKVADAPPASTFHYTAVHMAWSGATPVFESYVPSPNSNGDVDGRFVTPGSTKPALSGSYDAPYDRITIVASAADMGLNPGDHVFGFVVGSSQTTDAVNAGTGVTELYDAMPNSAAFLGAYTIGNSFDCDVVYRNGFE
ncbi:MAG TPA: sialidase family protein [Rudaea sp.]|nr:sialidase family protein [Rudaea sp.]